MSWRWNWRTILNDKTIIFKDYLFDVIYDHYNIEGNNWAYIFDKISYSFGL